MAEIKLGDNQIIRDTMNKIHKDKDGVICCGKIIRLVSHIDGTDFFAENYQCECGNSITCETKRIGKDLELWSD